jgi:hypothetical protein
MKVQQQKKPWSRQVREAMDDLGGEPLEGSGFEADTPEPEFSGDEHPAPGPPR